MKNVWTAYRRTRNDAKTAMSMITPHSKMTLRRRLFTDQCTFDVDVTDDVKKGYGAEATSFKASDAPRTEKWHPQDLAPQLT